VPDPTQSAINTVFCSALIALTQQAKQQMLTAVHLVPEVSALHATVKGLDLTFEEVFREKMDHRNQAVNSVGLSEEKVTSLFDEQLQLLRDIKQKLDQVV
jgi:hypothetical protein